MLLQDQGIFYDKRKLFSIWPNFPNQPNSLFYEKTFFKLVRNQNKQSLSEIC